MRKMEHRSWSRWSRWSRWSHGNDAMGRAAELQIQRRGSRTRAGSSASCPRAQVGPPRLIQRLYLGEISLWVILRRTKIISIPFFHQKCAKWNTYPGAGGATETTPWAAPQSFGSSAWGACELLKSSSRISKTDPDRMVPTWHGNKKTDVCETA